MKWKTEFCLRIGIVLSFILLVIAAPSVLFPFTISLIIAVLLTPVAKTIYQLALRIGLKKMNYEMAIILSFCIFIAVIYLIAIHILVPFWAEFRQFAKSVPGIIQNVQETLPALEEKYQLNLLPPEVQSFIARTIQDIGAYILKAAQFSIYAIVSFATAVVQLIVVPFITFYMMKRGNQFVDGFIKLFPSRYSAHLKLLFEEIYFVLHAYIRGQIILSALIGFVVFIGMLIMDIPYPLVIGLLASIVEMIPLIGPIIGAVPPILLGALQGTTVMIQVIVFYVVVQQLDGHFVMPKLMGAIIDVHPVAIIAAVLIAGHLFGVVGMMIAVPFVAVLQILLRHMWFYERYKSLR